VQLEVVPQKPLNPSSLQWGFAISAKQASDVMKSGHHSTEVAPFLQQKYSKLDLSGVIITCCTQLHANYIITSFYLSEFV